jgi:hypothetical protein
MKIIIRDVKNLTAARYFAIQDIEAMLFTILTEKDVDVVAEILEWLEYDNLYLEVVSPLDDDIWFKIKNKLTKIKGIASKKHINHNTSLPILYTLCDITPELFSSTGNGLLLPSSGKERFDLNNLNVHTADNIFIELTEPTLEDLQLLKEKGLHLLISAPSETETGIIDFEHIDNLFELLESHNN